MESLFGEGTIRYLKYTPLLIYSLIIGLFEWIIPRSWYAKKVDTDIVLITGAGSGLGRAIALEYAKLNASLILWDINEQGLKETEALVASEFDKNQSLGSAKRICFTYRVDVSNREEVKSKAEQVYLDLNKDRKMDETEKYVSILVNNAGIYHGLMLTELRDDQIERIFKINILSHFWTVRAFLPQMIKHERGHIVEIASMGGIAGLLKQVDYCATKFATVGFEESLSIELSYMGLEDKIRTTVICPFFFSSNLFSGFNTNVASMMTTEYVAEETVMAARCNHSRVMLPKLNAYGLYAMKTYMPRKAMILYTKLQGLAEGIKEIKGAAADIAA